MRSATVGRLRDQDFSSSGERALDCLAGRGLVDGLARAGG